jgi:hypothetical protein
LGLGDIDDGQEQRQRDGQRRDVEHDREGDAQAAEEDRLERRRRRADVVGVERGDEQRRAGQGGNEHERRVGHRRQPRHDAHHQRQPDGARHERRELGRMQLRKLRGDEEVDEGGADNS